MSDAASTDTTSRPAQKRSSGPVFLILSGVALVLSAGALAGSWLLVNGYFGAPASNKNIVDILDTAAARAETSRSADDLAFLNSLATNLVAPNGNADELSTAARLQFSIANSFYDQGARDSASAAATSGANNYSLAKRTNGSSAAELWLQWKDMTAKAKSGDAPDPVETNWQAAGSVAKQLVAIDAVNVQFLRANWLSSRRVVDAMRTSEDTATAEAEASTAVDAARQVTKLRPTQQSYSRDLWISLIAKGDLLFRNEKLADSKSAYEEALTLAQAAVKAVPNDRSQGDLYSTLIKLGSVNAKSGDIATARTNFKAALDLATASAAANATMQSNAIQAQVRLADLEQDAGDIAASKAFYEQAIAGGNQLVASDPTNLAFARDLARNYASLGAVAATQKDVAGATAAYGSSAKLRATILSAEPSNVVYHRELVAAYEKLAQTTKDASTWKLATRAAENLGKHAEANDSDRKLVNRVMQGAAK